MKFSALFVLLVVANAHPTPIKDKIHRVLAYLKQAQSNGEWAVNTPNGIYPIKDINDNNILDVFNFRPELEKELKNEGETAQASELVHSEVESTNSGNAPPPPGEAGPSSAATPTSEASPANPLSEQTGYDAPSEPQQTPEPADETATPSAETPTSDGEKPSAGDHSAEVPTRDEEHQETPQQESAAAGYGQGSQSAGSTESSPATATEPSASPASEETTTPAPAAASTEGTPTATSETAASVPQAVPSSSGDGYQEASTAAEKESIVADATTESSSDSGAAAALEASSSAPAGYPADETVGSSQEALVSEAPATERPATETPTTETPATEAPVTEAPATETPATETLATETLATEASTESPATTTGLAAPAEQAEPAVDSGYPVAAPATAPEENKPSAPMPVPNNPTQLGYPA